MTKETRYFIELSDILSLQFRCGKCGATVSRPIAAFNDSRNSSCPNCGAIWTMLDDEMTDKRITELVNAIGIVKRVMDRKGFTLQIEISGTKDKETPFDAKEDK